MSYTDPTEAEAANRREGLRPFDEYNSRALYSTFALFGTPHTYLDIGSGTGVMVKMARRLGVDAVGVDVIAEPPDIRADLTRPLYISDRSTVYEPPHDIASMRSFTIITCVEVAEHLPPEAAPVLCATLARHLAPRGWLVFTSALPGQAGDHHQNLIPPFDWRGMLYEAGLTWMPKATTELALLWTHTTGNLHHLPANLQCFTSREGW